MTNNSKKEIFFNETLKLIYEKGFRAMTMRDIAERMGFEVSNIYNYVDSKETILEIYLFRILRDFTIYLDDIMDSSYSPVEKLKLVISRHVLYTAEKPYEVSLFVNEWRNLNKEKLIQFEEQRIDYMRKVGIIISDGIETGELRNMNVNFATFTVFSSMRWLFDMIANADGKVNPIELDKQLTDFIFHGIEKNKQLKS